MDRDFERLEENLERLSQAMRYADTPEIAEDVARRIGERPARRLVPGWAMAAMAVAAVAVLLAALTAIVPPVRDAVADVFDRINIFEDSDVPEDVTTEIEGEPLTLAEAETLTGIDLLLPEGLEPDEVLFQDFGELKATAIFFDDPEAGEFVLFETDGDVDKFLSPEADWAPVEGLEGDAYWLTGRRLVQYRVEGGGTIQESARVTDLNTLVWEQGRYVFRLEGNLLEAQAVEIARSLR